MKFENRNIRLEIKNDVEITFLDKNTKECTIILNGKHMGVTILQDITAPNGFDKYNSYQIRLANIHNQSNPIVFKTRTLKGLIGKIKKHKFVLVRY